MPPIPHPFPERTGRREAALQRPHLLALVLRLLYVTVVTGTQTQTQSALPWQSACLYEQRGRCAYQCRRSGMSGPRGLGVLRVLRAEVRGDLTSPPGWTGDGHWWPLLLRTSPSASGGRELWLAAFPARRCPLFRAERSVCTLFLLSSCAAVNQMAWLGPRKQEAEHSSVRFGRGPKRIPSLPRRPLWMGQKIPEA